MLRFVRRDDTLVVTKLDRLARSVNDLNKITRQFRTKALTWL
ncbi:MAG: recombinase family protein [Deltaproteobacteria bacterium]|nr:recombinase family protein [Deltaproteobacteria bacterium]